MKRLSGIRILMLAAGVCGFAMGTSAAAETAQAALNVLWQENFECFERWRIEGPETLAAALDTEFSAGDTCLKYTFKVDDPAKGHAWPQQVRYFKPVPLDGNDVYLEFDAYCRPIRGEVPLRLSMKEIAEIRAPSFKLKPKAWTHVKVPLLGKKPGVSVKGYAFVIDKRSVKAGSEAVFHIKNLRIVRGEKFETRPVSLLNAGIFSQKVVPASSCEKDKRMEIEIPNLVNNGYFRLGGKDFPPPGWSTYGVGSYGESYHDGRSVHLPGADQKAIALRQNGLVLIPGERYRMSGYIRGGGFTGRMDGQIVVACPRWSLARGYYFTDKDIKPDWQYFEVVFTPEPSSSGEYEAIIYRTGAGGGWIEVDRLIVEPLSEKGLKGSRNKYADDDYDANYAKALKEGKFRSGPPSPDYKLVWSDEFDGDTVNLDNWKVYEMFTKGERDYRLVPSAVKLDGKGHILFTTSLAADGKVEQPRISTTGHKPFTFGYLECRFQLHDSNLANASFWMLPEGHMDARDPVHKGMEIDIMECISPSLNNLSHTTHWYSNIDGKKVSFSGGTRARHAPGLNKGWHTVALEWTPTDLVFFIDGVQSWKLNTKDHPIPVNPHNIIFSFGGRNKEIMKIPGFKTTFMADYVRLYQKESAK